MDSYIERQVARSLTAPHSAKAGRQGQWNVHCPLLLGSAEALGIYFNMHIACRRRQLCFLYMSVHIPDL